MINDVLNFLPHFLSIFSISASNLHFSPSLRFPFHYTTFRFQFQPERNYLLTLNQLGFKLASATEPCFLVLSLFESPSMKRHLNSWEDKAWCREDFIHKVWRKKCTKRSERCNLFSHRLLFSSPFRNDVRKKEAKEFSAQLLRRTFKRSQFVAFRRTWN